MAEVVEAILAPVLAGQLPKRLPPLVEHVLLLLAGSCELGRRVLVGVETPRPRQRDAEFLHLLHAERDIEPAEGTGQRVLVPWLAFFVAEKRTRGMAKDELARDVQRLLGQIDDAWALLAFRFLDGEHPATVGEIDVPGFDARDLLRPGAG